MTKKILLTLLAFSLSFLVGVNVVQAIGQEDTGWDAVYDTNPSNNHDAILYNGTNRNGSMSLATRSNGYPGIAYTKELDPNGLAYIECTSGDCASGDGVGSAQWSSETLIESVSGRSGEMPALDFDANDYPVIAFMDVGPNLRMAKYTPGSTSGCSAAPSDWTCFDIASARYDARPDIVIDSNNNHYIAFKDPSYDLSFTYCNYNSGAGVLCDDPADYTVYTTEIHAGAVFGISLDVDSSGVFHVSYADGTDVYYGYCDPATASCAEGEVDGGQWTTYKLSSAASGADSKIDVSTGTKGIAFTGSSSFLKYAEYVGSGGNCDASPWSGDPSADAWSCTDVTTGDLDVVYNGSTQAGLSFDISSTGERGIAWGDEDAPTWDVHYATCTSGCTTDSNWTDDRVFYDDENVPGSPPHDWEGEFGTLTSFEFGSGPRIAFGDQGNGTYQDVYYAEQESDTPPEEQIVPELPQNNIWKVLIAVLAVGLVVGIVAWRNKNKD